MINLHDPDDCLAKYVDMDRDRNFIKERMDLLVEVLGPEEPHEVTRSVFYAGDEMQCHIAIRGFETMFVGDGEIEVTVRGRKCRVGKGDILHFGSYNAHRMRWLKDTPWVGFFHKMNISQPTADKMLLSENCPDMKDSDLDEIFRESYDCYYLAEPVAVEVPKSEIAEIRAPEFAFATFALDGVTMLQKIGRWETDGMYEIWELHMEDGFYVESSKPNPKACIYYVTEGNVRFRVFDNEFVAPRDSIVHLPPYAIHSFQSAGKSVMFDMTGSTMSFDLLSEWKSYEAYAPEKLKDREFVASLKKKYQCYVDGWGRK
jgi:quercetin dioxygenase-like cupin family protein